MKRSTFTIEELRAREQAHRKLISNYFLPTFHNKSYEKRKEELDNLNSSAIKVADAYAELIFYRESDPNYILER